jgi:hypothetical protein
MFIPTMCSCDVVHKFRDLSIGRRGQPLNLLPVGRYSTSPKSLCCDDGQSETRYVSEVVRGLHKISPSERNLVRTAQTQVLALSVEKSRLPLKPQRVRLGQ